MTRTVRAPSSIAGQLPPGHHLENIAAGPDETLYVTDYFGQALHTLRAGEGFRLHVAVPFGPLDLTFDADGVGVVAVHEQTLRFGPGFVRTNAFHLLHPDGRTERLVRAPDAKFLNGVVRLAPGVFLAADSYGGMIWRLDRATATVTPWKSDELFRRIDENAFDPGLNGLKLHDGYLYASNTARALILRLRVTDGQPGAVEVVEEDLRCDDFIFGRSGTLYCAGQGRTATAVAPDGTRTVFGTPEDSILGATSCCFGVADADRHVLYVSATGGLVQGLHEPACLVAFRVDDEATEVPQK